MFIHIFPSLYIALTIALIVGMFRPDFVLRWAENPSRKKVFLYWLLATIALGWVQDAVETHTIKQRSQKAEKVDPEPKGHTTTNKDMEQATETIKEALASANERAEKGLFKTLEIEDSGEIISITMTDDWYHIPDYMKERLIKFLVQRITAIAEENKISYDDGRFTEPFIWLQDQYGEKLATGMGRSWEIHK